MEARGCIKKTVNKLSHQGDNGRVDDGGYQCSQAQTMEGGMTDRCPIEGRYIAKQDKSKGDRDCEERDVKYPFSSVNIEVESVGKLCHEQLVYLKGKIGTKEAGNTKAGNAVAYDQHDPAETNRIKRDASQYPKEEIQHVSVKNGDGKGQKISPVEAADDEAEKRQHKPLNQIFGHTYAKTAPKRCQRFKNNKSRSSNHGNAEICFATNRHTKCDEDDAQKP